MLIKSRAHKPLATGNTTSGFYPHGVGGMPTNDPCVALSIDDYKLIMTKQNWEDVKRSVDYLILSYDLERLGG